MYEFEVEISLISTQRLITVILNIPFVMKTKNENLQTQSKETKA